MPEDTTGQEGQQQQQAAGGGDSYTPPATQAELDRIVSERLNRERAKFSDYDDLKAKASKLDEIDAANKTEAQRQAEKLTAAEQEKATLAAQVARLNAAIEHGLTKEDVEALDGVPADKVEALAQRLAGTKNGTTTRTTAAGLASGAGGGNQQLTGKERAAAALRAFNARNE